jgi:hypothetical protein
MCFTVTKDPSAADLRARDRKCRIISTDYRLQTSETAVALFKITGLDALVERINILYHFCRATGIVH